MARKVKDSGLDTREARSKRKARGKPYWTAIGRDLHLGYRRLKAQDGTWTVRRYLGEGKYETEAIGAADDISDANGTTILDFWQAQKAAREWLAQRSAPATNSGPITVKEACDNYVEYLRAHKKTANDAAGRLALHILPTIGGKAIAALTKSDIEKCQRGMVKRDPDDPEVERRSKDSANRVMNMLKAALNRAFEDEDNGIPTDAAWRRVKPFKQVGRARQVHLDPAQSMRLVNATSGKFRWLVLAALLTGARTPHELAARRVRDFRADLGTLSLDGGKTGARDIVLHEQAVRFFREITAGRAPDELLLPKDDGGMWDKSHHTRPMTEAVKRAKLPKDCTIYSLRHTYASQSLLAGMNIKMLADNMGSSIRMIETHYAKFVAAARRKLVEQAAFKLPGFKPGKVAFLDRAAREA